MPCDWNPTSLLSHVTFVPSTSPALKAPYSGIHISLEPAPIWVPVLLNGTTPAFGCWPIVATFELRNSTFPESTANLVVPSFGWIVFAWPTITEPSSS